MLNSHAQVQEQVEDDYGDYSVLITGPSGAGKTTLAKKIHESSNRRREPFVAVNLATLHSGTVESEIFGYERGAFTGADRSKPGLLERADGGTVFFDEIAELPIHLQPRLLDFVDTGSIRRMGASYEKTLNVRIISATNRDLWSEVQSNNFRQDLFFRLRAQEIRLKPISESGEKLDELTHKIVTELSASKQKRCLSIHPDVATRFERYSWPGNYRELRNILDYATSHMHGSQIVENSLPPWFLEESDRSIGNGSPESIGTLALDLPISYEQARKSFDNAFFKRALEFFEGDLERCLEATNVSRATFYRKKATPHSLR